MRILHLESIDSTNSYIKREALSLSAPVMVIAREQTAGRGQRGNSWESIPGENLTFSMFLQLKEFPVNKQFHISEAFALGVCDALEKECEVMAMVKWPNDIYVEDRKICGILIEHSVDSRHLIHTIAGAGVNINQERFFSDAPNPVSVRQLKGEIFDLDSLAGKFADHIECRLERIASQIGREEIHAEFRQRLWRGDGKYYPFHDKTTNEEFLGRIDDVAPSGYLYIIPTAMSEKLLQSPAREADGRLKYAFKEVEFLLNLETASHSGAST